MNILALDDESGALKILVRAIEANCPTDHIHSFTDPEEALRFAKQEKIDIAFLDIQMPGVSGLEAAKRLKKLQPEINIIFATGFSDYAVDAFRLHSSGYLLKPVTKNDVAMELENLRLPPHNAEQDRGVSIRTFGSFDVFRNGKLLHFRRERAKEILAYLVSKRGSSVTRKELAAVIFEDDQYTRSTQTYLTQLLNQLKKTLEDADLGDLLVSEYNSYAVDTKQFSCDSYRYLDGDAAAINSFCGEYMTQYSWAEMLTPQFYE